MGRAEGLRFSCKEEGKDDFHGWIPGMGGLRQRLRDKPAGASLEETRGLHLRRLQ